MHDQIIQDCIGSTQYDLAIWQYTSVTMRCLSILAGITLSLFIFVTGVFSVLVSTVVLINMSHYGNVNKITDLSDIFGLNITLGVFFIVGFAIIFVSYVMLVENWIFFRSRRSPYMTLHSEGIYFRQWGLVPWEDITDVAISWVRGVPFLELKTKHPDRYANRVRRFFLSKLSASLVGVKMPPEHVLDAIRNHPAYGREHVRT